MCRYYFHLRTAAGLTRDTAGTDLPDEASARSHAATVVGELMRNREAASRSWRLDVYDQTHAKSFELPFASIDTSLDHLTPELRDTLIEYSARSAALAEAIGDLRISLLRIKNTLAKAEGRLFLKAIDGVVID